MDTKRLERFDTPGHWATGQRSEKVRTRGAGHVYVHCVVDDHSRLAYAECHTADSAQAAAATLERAINWFTELGCQPPEAVMTDNTIVFHDPVRPGDVLKTRQVLQSVSGPKTTKLGTGRFWVIDVEYLNQRDELVGVETYTGFGYRRGEA